MDQRRAGLAQATMRNRWVALRNLYGWAVDEAEIERSPLEKVVVAKANPPAPDVISDDDRGRASPSLLDRRPVRTAP